jgi:hypothetical protein
MVRALLAGTKTQTRRVVKGERASRGMESGWFLKPYGFLNDRQFAAAACPYGQPGDRLWVRETWMPDAPRNGEWADTSFYGCGMSPLSEIPECYRKPWHCLHRATYDGCELVGWKPSIHMPRWACRVVLEITGVRVERLQDISNEDARAEGVLPKYADDCVALGHPYNAIHLYRELWGHINGAGSWDANPWVWVVEFKRAEAA